MAIEEGVGIKKEGLMGCKEWEKGIPSKEEALVINARGAMATTTPCNVYVVSKKRVSRY